MEISLPLNVPASQLGASIWHLWLASFVLQFVDLLVSPQLVHFLPEAFVHQCSLFFSRTRNKLKENIVSNICSKVDHDGISKGFFLQDFLFYTPTEQRISQHLSPLQKAVPKIHYVNSQNCILPLCQGKGEFVFTKHCWSSWLATRHGEEGLWGDGLYPAWMIVDTGAAAGPVHGGEAWGVLWFFYRKLGGPRACHVLLGT